jgi:hypothetical protein
MERAMLSNATMIADVQQELSPGESLLWSGRPRQGLMLRASDALLIPFSCLWAGFAVFWETGVVTSGAPFFFMLWGIPFLLVGAYITVGRFFVDAYIRSRTSYAVTNERALIVAGLFSRTVKSLPLQSMGEVTLQRHANDRGTITFGPSLPFGNWYRGFAWPGVDQRLPPAFEQIADASYVYETIRQMQRQR